MTKNVNRLDTLVEATEKGYLGEKVDPTPDEAYTLAGVTSSDTAAKADNAAEEGEAPPKPSKGKG